jgi:hypothetical protein|tara:strand:- start:1964 stop:2278 length:315 start_codon:yes stop_codon:yes gene_type:complete
MADVKNLNPDLQDKEPQLSKEELSKRREEITEFYKDNIPHLEVQADYESLLAAIEKARAERMQAQMFMAQQYASQKEGGGVDPNSEDGKAFQEAMSKAMDPKNQ